jgi:hypothetical protein
MQITKFIISYYNPSLLLLLNNIFFQVNIQYNKKMPTKQGIGRIRKKLLTTTTKSPPEYNTAINYDSIINTDKASVSVDLKDEADKTTPTLSTYLQLKDINIPVLDKRVRRLAIAYLFQIYGSPEDTLAEPWTLKGSPICLTAKVRKAFQL